MITLPRRVLVDADGLIYLAGFGVEKTHYDVAFVDQDGKEYWAPFSSVAAIKDYLAMSPDIEEMCRMSWKEVGPVEHALQIVKQKMNAIVKLYGPEMEVYIRAEEQKNFRDTVATIKKYKGNRTSAKPVHYDAIREYLKSQWNAMEVDDQEVDDEVGCRLTELELLRRQVVIVSPDKDLDQFPGQHYSYKTDSQYEIDEDEAEHWFWTQILTGDSSDNIGGCWKVGKKQANDLMVSIANLDDAEKWDVVVNTYAESMGLNGCPYAGMPAEAVALENAQLVYMRRLRGEIWMPPGTPNIDEDEYVNH